MKILLLLFLATPAFAASYISVENGKGVYDVEIIVFTRLQPQPPAKTIANAQFINLDGAVLVEPRLPDQEVYINQTQENTEQWNVPVEEQSQTGQALVWYETDDSKKMHGVLQKLQQSQEYQPLLHKLWRQPFTPFNNPQYVIMDEIYQLNSPMDDEPISVLETFSPLQNITDKTLHGKIALSRGRFSHLHVKMNLVRVNLNDERIVYAIDETRQIQLNQLNYFDHREFGVLIQVRETQLITDP
ncbi:CsiV family protein [Marinicella sp. W31]|uniref:CsiV family protein n=1 Tax=Marinicella sp. W31 TaxID=3023713 RepID=UPI00375645BC